MNIRASTIRSVQLRVVLELIVFLAIIAGMPIACYLGGKWVADKVRSVGHDDIQSEMGMWKMPEVEDVGNYR